MARAWKSEKEEVEGREGVLEGVERSIRLGAPPLPLPFWPELTDLVGVALPGPRLYHFGFGTGIFTHARARTMTW